MSWAESVHEMEVTRPLLGFNPRRSEVNGEMLYIEESSQCRNPALFFVRDFASRIAENRVADSSNELAPVEGYADDNRCSAALTQMADHGENLPESLFSVR